MNEISKKRWGMTVDINRCVGCQTCTIACKHANDTVPGIQWRKVLDVESGKFPDVERLFMVVGCQHCNEPPCVPVCPTGATKQREDGLVTMDYDRCIGCASCAVACPYQARTIVHKQEYYYGEQTIQEEAVAHKDRFALLRNALSVSTGLMRDWPLGLNRALIPKSRLFAQRLAFPPPFSSATSMIRQARSPVW
ncbi:MAG: 4Fe-4S dicluster domain-containing protein [Rhodospirillales bacterium]|nr:4Fe-4S dicluster domain-containing protein [Rhodospirillales bacterium]